MGKIAEVVKPGVVTGSDLQFIFKVAKENKFRYSGCKCG